MLFRFPPPQVDPRFLRSPTTDTAEGVPLDEIEP
uniref:Uncharacterized protein n=1 Tax=Arundo donax TaxID=35708 RepID=A0A0A9GE62_ARUDO